MRQVLTGTDKIKLFPLWLITLLPLRILYIFSDFLYLLAYYLVRYRRKVVYENLKNSFPEKSDQERKKIERKFYRYLAEYFIESLYILNMSTEELLRRFSLKNPEVMIEKYNSGKDIIVGLAHYGNWEWGTILPYLVPHKFIAVYRPLSNKVFDRLFIQLRSKYGGHIVPIKSTLRSLVEARKKGETFALYLLGDQRPIREDLGFWTTFLGQETPVITGIDRLSRKFDTQVYYLQVKRVRRGYYSVSYELITDKPTEEKEMGVAEKFIRKVESVIKEEPAYWFWSHKRWRYSPEEYKPGYKGS
jgi:KDO2-lipid IV(A) lauroyltransferase